MSQSAAATQAIVDDKNAVYKRITLRLIPFIFICYLFNYLDRVNVGFAKLQMLDALKFSETVYGLGAGRAHRAKLPLSRHRCSVMLRQKAQETPGLDQ
ncbi:hypothetical protein ACQKP9_28685, partial [Pseudomonas mandelii]